MKYAHNTVLLLPLLTIDEQKEVTELSFALESLPSGKAGRVSLMGIPTSIAAITCTLPEPRTAGDGGPAWSSEESEWIKRATNHMLSIIQSGYDKNADYFRPNDHEIISFMHFSENEKPIFGLAAELHDERPIVNAQGLAESYSTTAEKKLHNVMELLSESMAWRIPAHYRFLALYKIIELEHPRRTADFHSSMDQEYFVVNQARRPLRKLLPRLRVKIAHGLALGATAPGLSDDDRAAITRLIPIMQDAIRADIAQRYSLRFTIDPK